MPVLVEGPCSKCHLCKYIFAEPKFQGGKPQSFCLFGGMTENMVTERLHGRDSEKYNQLLKTSCYCLSMGNKYYMYVSESIPDVICLELQSTYQKSRNCIPLFPGTDHHRMAHCTSCSHVEHLRFWLSEKKLWWFRSHQIQLPQIF